MPMKKSKYKLTEEDLKKACEAVSDMLIKEWELAAEEETHEFSAEYNNKIKEFFENARKTSSEKKED